MPRQKANPDVNELITEVLKQPTRGAQIAVGSRVTAASIKRPKSIGRPTTYTQKLADDFCKRITEGQTITKACKDLGISLMAIYRWRDKYSDFRERYNRAKEDQATSLISQLVDEFQDNLTNENALAARTKSDLYRWIAARQNPAEFSDVKKIELRGEVRHLHTHELAPEQKRRIAESWLISQQEKDFPGIELTTTGPDREPGVIVQEEEPKELPRRKKLAVKKPALEVDESGKWRGH
jgi:hypothetical protein